MDRSWQSFAFLEINELDDNKIIGDRVEEKDYKRNPEEDWEKKYNEEFKLYHRVLPEDYEKKDIRTMFRYVRGGEKQVVKEHKKSGLGRVSRPSILILALRIVSLQSTS